MLSSMAAKINMELLILIPIVCTDVEKRKPILLSFGLLWQLSARRLHWLSFHGEEVDSNDRL